jgi:hypothetical protein
MTFWMEHEFRQYPAYHPDLDALAAVAEKIVPAGGRDSREKGNMPFLPVVTLAGRLGRVIAEFPGGHVGYAEYPGDFAAQLGRLLGAEAARSVDTWHGVLASRPARNSRGGPVTAIEHPLEHGWCTP